MAWFGSVLGWERMVMDGEHRLLEPGPASFDTLLGAAVVSAEAGRWSIIVLLVIVGPCPVRVSHRDFRIRRPVRSFRQYLLCRVVLSRSSSSR